MTVGVRLEQVRLTLEGRDVLKGLSLELPAGSHWLLLGANGAGKTQLLKLLAGERWPTPTGRERRVYTGVRGVPLDLPDLLPQLALVGGERQDKYVRHDWNFTVQAVVATGCDGVDRPLGPLRPAERIRVRALLRRFDLWALRRRRFLTLSYGERRLTLLARALAGRPRLLLLDEPYNGLDASARATLDRELARLGRSALTVVVSSHRARDAPAFDRALVLERGRIVYAGSRAGLPGRWLSDEPAAREAAARHSACHTRVPAVAAHVRGRAAGSPHAVAVPLLLLGGVELYRDHRPVLRDVHWTLGPGEHWAIVGANGSGKSTLLRFVYGELPAALGSVYERRGHAPGTHLEEWRRRVALVSPELQAEYRDEVTVEELVVSGLRSSVGLDRPPDADERRQARAALRQCGIGRWRARSWRTMSYGQRRLALIARALVLGPELLLLDEPLTGLDFEWRRRVQSLLRRLARGGTQLVMAVHHEQDLVPEVGHVLRLRDGAAAQERRHFSPSM